MNVNWPLLIIATLNLGFSTVCDVFAKYWGVSGDPQWLYAGLALNIGTVFFYMWSIRIGGLAITSSAILLLTVIISVALGFFYFDESIHLSQWIGIALSIPALILISGILLTSGR